eukprot:CAMPEP_0183770802 /NCGR_PEP_ID=MMETSP0739-20130205/30080_1 /TAXON_ID=385413 /ORGANISM="Thalassiosira miniscula, Strain CCMP1093" /LENGTH=102 /DNA_ID=CAMNT_0026010953 /DNA_START=308 /DNA_END=616 /DNA_ORIENTATION=+
MEIFERGGVDATKEGRGVVAAIAARVCEGADQNTRQGILPDDEDGIRDEGCLCRRGACVGGCARCANGAVWDWGRDEGCGVGGGLEEREWFGGGEVEVADSW